MAQLFGAITLGDVTTFADSRGQVLIYGYTQEYLNFVNAEADRMASVFVERTTEDHTERYKMPGGGRLQRRGLQTQVGATKATGSWDVAYPLEDFGAQIAGDDVSLAYMSVEDYNTHIQSVVIQNANTIRFEILKALFNNVARTFVDPLRSTLTIQPLANGDATVYPPINGAETEATSDHYLESGYAASAISDTNNPYATIVNKLTEVFGPSTGGSNIVTFINSAQTAKTAALTNFYEVQDSFIRVGSNTDVPMNLPNVPGKIIGRMSDGTWVVEWAWVPSGWMIGINLEQPAPLKMRVDPAYTGLGRGLQLVATDAEYPFQFAFWRHRFGVGVGNRLNGVVMELGTGGTYTIPTAYA
jgi:hypothetical protein